MKKVKIMLFEVTELEAPIQSKVIEEHRQFLLSVFDSTEYVFPYTKTQYRAELNKAYIIEQIEFNDYYYFANGEMAGVITYVDAHPKAGKTELTLHGTTYTL